MFLKHELWIHNLIWSNFSCPGSDWLRVVPHIFALKSWFPTFGQSGGRGEEESASHHVKTPRESKETHQSSKARCFLRSCLLPGSTSMSISCFHISSSFKDWILFKITVYDDLNLQGPSQIDSGQLWGILIFSSWLACLGSFSKSILRRYQSNIL